MTEQAKPSIREVTGSVQGAEFQRAKTRIEVTRRIAQELSDGLFSKTPSGDRLRTLLTNERRYNPVDVSDYTLQRVRMPYHSPDKTQSISEELVFFLKAGENGRPEMLESDSEPLFFSKDLYDLQISPLRLMFRQK